MNKHHKIAITYTNEKPYFIFLALFALTLLLPIYPVHNQLFAQDSANNTKPSDIWYGYVTVDSLAVKNGRAPEYDEIARIFKGDLVVVREVNRFGWATIAVPKGTYAFIPARYVIEINEGTQVSTVGKVKLLYPTKNDPTQSWKGELLPPETKLDVIELIKTDEGDFYSVIMPDFMNAYIPAQYIRRATTEEIKQWEEKTGKNEADADNAEPDTKLPDTDENKTTPDLTDDDTLITDTVENIQNQDPIINDQSNTVDTPAEKNINIDNETNTLPDKAVVEDKNEITSDPTPEELADILDNTTPDVKTNETAVDTANEDNLTNDTDTTKEDTLDTEAFISETQIVDTELKQITDYLDKPVSWDTLDEMYINLKKISTLDAEIEPVIDGYKQIIANENETEHHRLLAEARIAILEIKLDFQKAQQQLNMAIAESQRIRESAASDKYSNQPGSVYGYDAIGIIASSSIYDGRRLPKLFRLLDEKSHRTILYFIPDKDKLNNDIKIGSTVGITGEYVSDPARNIRIMLIKQINVISDK